MSFLHGKEKRRLAATPIRRLARPEEKFHHFDRVRVCH
jgi:hypothetical protein